MLRKPIPFCLMLAFMAGTAVARLNRTTSAVVPRITLLRTPQGGIQPQTLLDHHGVLHMIYFDGDASGGDIEYVSRRPDQKNFGPPIRVNSEPRDALAVGTVRGPQMALGRNGRVYVIWFGARPKSQDSTNSLPVLFSRLSDSHTTFEPERNLVQYAEGGDGGISVAADSRGNVYAVWHGMGEKPGEDHRRVYLTHSTDDGKTFAREVPISPATLGACGCCGMRAFADERGTLFVVYRAARQSIHRDMTLLVSTDGGQTFRDTTLAPWEMNACPMSTTFLSEGAKQVLAAWETAGQVYFDFIDPTSLQPSSPIPAPGDSNKRKHPTVAAGVNGHVLLAWTEGTGWLKGGSLSWQLFDGAGKPVGAEGHMPGVPIWGLPSVFADDQGNFTVVY
jgi:hypothetical protein